MNLIAAIDNKWRIGYNNELLYHSKDDMRRFKMLTTHKDNNNDINVVIMGTKTLESFPNVEPLKDRFNIVLSFHKDELNKKYADYDNIVFVSNRKNALNIAHDKTDNHHIWVVGGGSIYSQFEQDCDVAYITRFFDDYRASNKIPYKPHTATNHMSHMPNLSEDSNWSMVGASQPYFYDAGILYQYQIYINNAHYMFNKGKNITYFPYIINDNDLVTSFPIK